VKKIIAALAITLAALTSGIAHAGTVITLTGTGMPSALMQTELGGEITNGNTVIPVGGPFSSPFTDSVRLQTVMQSLPPGTNITVFAYSKGAVAAHNWINRYGRTSTLHPSFVLIGDPTRLYGGTTPAPYNNSNFAVYDLTRQYDRYSDNPTVMSGSYFQALRYIKNNDVHQDYFNTSLYDPNNLVYQQNNVTYVLAPTPVQPALESAYNRPETLTAAAQGIVFPIFDPPVAQSLALATPTQVVQMAGLGGAKPAYSTITPLNPADKCLLCTQIKYNNFTAQDAANQLAAWQFVNHLGPDTIWAYSLSSYGAVLYLRTHTNDLQDTYYLLGTPANTPSLPTGDYSNVYFVAVQHDSVVFPDDPNASFTQHLTGYNGLDLTQPTSTTVDPRTGASTLFFASPTPTTVLAASTPVPTTLSEPSVSRRILLPSQPHRVAVKVAERASQRQERASERRSDRAERRQDRQDRRATRQAHRNVK
jgi:hypothetical protein